MARQGTRIPESINPHLLLSPKEVGQIYGLPESYLKRRRLEGDGPQYFKGGPQERSHVRYRVCDVEEWIANHLVQEHRSNEK